MCTYTFGSIGDHGGYLAGLTHPIVDHLPRSEYAKSLEGSFVAADIHRLMSMPLFDKNRSTQHLAWTYNPAGTIGPLQINHCGLQRQVFVVGAESRVWLLWPPTNANISLMAKWKDRTRFSADELMKFEDGSYNYASREENNSTSFIIPPYYTFTSLSFAGGAYVSRMVFEYSVTFARTLPWMRREMEMLRDGWTLDESKSKQRGINRFREILLNLKGETAVEGAEQNIGRIPVGFDAFTDGMVADLDKLASETVDPVIASYLELELE